MDERPIIMAIDDDPLVLNLTVGIVKKLYRVRPFTRTETAVKYLTLPRGPGADLILLDYQMPDMNGRQALEKLRSIPAAQNIPVLFLTGLTGDMEDLSGPGVAGVITKPPAPADLLARIELSLRRT